MSKLSEAQRKAIPKSKFAIPSKAPKSGSYPIPDRNHARDALARSSGKSEEGAVRAAVAKRYPGLVQNKDQKNKAAKAVKKGAAMMRRQLGK